MFHESVRTSRLEKTKPLPCDELIQDPIGSLTHAVTIRRAPHDVWPWLAQMGAGSRAGWYSYDFIDNGRHPSATRIVPDLQDISVGTIFQALPGMTDGFVLVAYEPERFLVLSWRLPSGTYLMTWAFVLEALGNDHTRLIVRARGGPGYRFRGMPTWMNKYLVPLGHYIMQRKQLNGIARRAEESTPPSAEIGHDA